MADNIRNRNKKSECLYLLSTDTSLNNAEIVRIYGNRWSIECFFKASKSFLKLGSEFQSRSYALQSLMALFVEHISTLSADITSVLKSKVTEWIASQAIFIQALLEISAGKVELLKNLKSIIQFIHVFSKFKINLIIYICCLDFIYNINKRFIANYIFTRNHFILCNNTNCKIESSNIW